MVFRNKDSERRWKQCLDSSKHSFLTYLEIKTPRGDGNAFTVWFLVVFALDLEIKTPRGDGYGILITNSISAILNLEIKTPRGDGNM